MLAQLAMALLWWLWTNSVHELHASNNYRQSWLVSTKWQLCLLHKTRRWWLSCVLNEHKTRTDAKPRRISWKACGSVLALHPHRCTRNTPGLEIWSTEACGGVAAGALDAELAVVTVLLQGAESVADCCLRMTGWATSPEAPEALKVQWLKISCKKIMLLLVLLRQFWISVCNGNRNIL